MKRLVIIGAGGHGRVIADIAEKVEKYNEIIFLDDADIKYSGGYSVVGRIDDYINYISNSEFIVAIGNPELREKFQSELIKQNATIKSFIHPSAVIADRVKIGMGTVIAAGAVIGPDVIIGDGVIINTSSSVDHDCVIKDYSHVSVGAHLAGTVEVGTQCMIGAGTTVINNLNICDGAVVGAGAVVVKDILEKGTYIGVPARKVK